MNVTGKVKIEATIAADGHVVNTKMVGGSPLLVNAALDASRMALRAGRKETTEVIEFDFNGQDVAPRQGAGHVVPGGQGAEDFQMTIGKKLYLGFGAILAIMLFLLVINIFTVVRQYSARDAVKATSPTCRPLKMSATR